MSGLFVPPPTVGESTVVFGRIDRLELNRFAGLRAMWIEWSAPRGGVWNVASHACLLLVR